MRIATIDVGTNTALLLIADIQGGVMTPLREEQRFARLGEGVDRTGRITAPPTQGNIPRTGSDYVEPALQIGAALLAAGTAAVVVSRRRRAGTAAA